MAKTIEVRRSVANVVGGPDALSQRVAAFRQALVDHARTVDVPAPIEHPLVEEVARSGADSIQIIEEDRGAPVPPSELEKLQERCAALEQQSSDLAARIAALEAAQVKNLEPRE